jgi:hypothetical protein
LTWRLPRKKMQSARSVDSNVRGKKVEMADVEGEI